MAGIARTMERISPTKNVGISSTVWAVMPALRTYPKTCDTMKAKTS
jgi:hypothetical protein